MRMKELREGPPKHLEPNGDPGLASLREGAAIVERPTGCVLRLAGKDPTGMLDAILTNNVPGDENLGAYALLLNPKGRIQTDLRVLKSGETIVIEAGPEGADAAREILGRYAPFSRVKLEDLSESWSVLGLYGPRAAEVLGGLELAENQTSEVTLGDDTLLVVGVARPVAGYDLIGPSESTARAGEILSSRGASPADPRAYETIRITAGVPRFGKDMTPENFPGEAGVLERAVDFTKGCYPGQETVARMRYRGHPNRTLFKLSTESTGLAPEAPILQNDKQVGKITSVAPLSLDGETFVLGYLSRKTDLDAPLTAGGAALRVLGEAG
jgi:tRNA-modifying protein YgfZ